MNKTKIAIDIQTDSTLYFERLFVQYQPKLIRFLSSLLHDEELSRDMAQDIFLKLWNTRSQLPDIENFSSYLFRMAKNTVFNHFEHIAVQTKYEVEEFYQSEMGISVEENLFAQELQELINIRVEQMPLQRKRIFRMSRVEGLSNDEIAKRLDINKRTVENHITSALADLRKLIYLAIFFI